MPKSLKQLKAKLDAKRAQIAEVFDCKSTNDDGEVVYDLQSFDADWLPEDVGKLKGHAKTIRILELVNGEKTKEIDELHDQVVTLEKTHQLDEEHQKRERTPADPVLHPDSGGGERKDDKRERRSVGKRIVEHPEYKRWREVGFRPGVCPPIILKDVGLNEIKTLFETTAGWAPESTRTGRVVDAVTRPPQVMDIMPTGQTGQELVVYMLESTRTHSAAEKAEGAAYAESAFVLTETTSAVRKITDSIPVTDEQLEDVMMAESYLEGRLLFGIQQRLDGQIVAGNGTPPNLDGIVNVSGISTNANAGEPVPDTIYTCMKDVRVTGRAVPTHVLMHPNDWADIRLERTADGIYLWGNPSDAGPMRIFGLPVVENESLSENTGLIGSFMPSWIQLVERRGITVEVGFVNDDFTKGKKTLRASGRWALPVYRPAAFCTATSI